MSEEKLNFSELDISIGQLVDVLPQQSTTKAFTQVVVVGTIPQQALIITAPESGIFPKLDVGEKLIFRLGLSDGLAIFAAQVLFISEVPAFMVYVDLPGVVTFKRVRNATRVSVSLPVLVSNVSSKQQSGLAGRIIDISTTGAGLEMFDPLGSNGDRIKIKGKFTVGSIQRVLSIDAVIRMSKRVSEKIVFYGIEFLESDENDLLVLFGFIFNAMSFGKIKKMD